MTVFYLGTWPLTRLIAVAGLFHSALPFGGGIFIKFLIPRLRRRFTMRLASLAVIGLVLATSPVSAKPASQAADPRPACVAKLQSVAGSSGYRMVRSCAKSGAQNGDKSLAVARKPVVNGSDFADAGASSVVVSLFALGALVGGIWLASDDSNRTLPDGGDGGLDPASP